MVFLTTRRASAAFARKTLRKRAIRCAIENKKIPNFIVVDYYTKELFKLVKDLNDGA